MQTLSVEARIGRAFLSGCKAGLLMGLLAWLIWEMAQ